MKSTEINVKVFNQIEPLVFEKIKSRDVTRFVNIRKNNGHSGLSDIIPLFVGAENCVAGHSFGPFARSSYLIHYVTSGKGVFVSKGKQYVVKEGEAFIIVPDEITTYTADKIEPWSYVWVAFNGTYAKELNTLEKPVLALSSEPFNVIKRIVSGEKDCSAELVTSLIFGIFAEIFDKHARNDNVVVQIENYIKTQYMTDISVDGIANAVGLDRRYVGKLFKNAKGVSMQEYIIETRLDRAKELLKHGYKVGDAAVMSGYKDQFNFTKMFSKRFGLSPRAYAKQFK